MTGALVFMFERDARSPVDCPNTTLGGDARREISGWLGRKKATESDSGIKGN
jgi:hypothetical protein